MHAAAEARAQVLVFPELSLTGYELDLADALAFSEEDPRLAPLVEVASSCRISLIVGAPVRTESVLHIGAFIVSPDRSIDLYTKHHLGAFPPDASPDGIVPLPERAVFRPGDRDPLVRFGGVTAAVAVCADTSRPSHPQAAAERGAQAYLASMFIIPSDLVTESANLQSTALRHSMAVVLANYGGPSGGLPSGGCSAIWSARGDLLAQLGETGAGIVVAAESDAGWVAETITLDVDDRRPAEGRR